MKGRRVCVLSYQVLHKKTIDVLVQLKLQGYHNVCVYAKPFHYVKKYKPLIEHRPHYEDKDLLYLAGYENLIFNLGYELRKIDAYEEIKEKERTIFLICGAGILPQDMISKYCIVNSHPGYLPMVRGLDSLKWAIMEKKPIGVTVHLLGKYVDAGEIIQRRKVPIYENDTFHAVAYRQYEMEIQLLADAAAWQGGISMITDGEDYLIHKRMSNELEKKLFIEFENYKNEYFRNPKDVLPENTGGGIKL